MDLIYCSNDKCADREINDKVVDFYEPEFEFYHPGGYCALIGFVERGRPVNPVFGGLKTVAKEVALEMISRQSLGDNSLDVRAQA